MINKDKDISQIYKYPGGELDAKDMHRLEKIALEDPFVMDALEGYEKVAVNQKINLDQLSGNLQKRIAIKQRKVIVFKTISIAASLIIALSIGGLLLYNARHTAMVPKITAEIKPQTTATILPAPVVKEEKREMPKSTALHDFKHPKKIADGRGNINFTPGSFAANSPAANTDSVNKGYKKEDIPAAAPDSTPLNEMIVIGYTAQKKKAATNVELKEVKTKTTDVTEQLLKVQADGVTKTNPDSQPYHYMNTPLKKEVIMGRVIGKDDGQPVAGARVSVAGTNTGTITDANGKFILHADSTKSKLVVGFIGYKTRELNLHNKDSLKTIALEPSGSALAEVIVTGYTAATTPADTAFTKARPGTGWVKFNKYLKENAVSPDGKKGIVHLSFEVDHDGVISNINITNSLSTVTDQKAIDLLKNGPAWLGNTSGKPELIKIKIRFEK